LPNGSATAYAKQACRKNERLAISLLNEAMRRPTLCLLMGWSGRAPLAPGVNCQRGGRRIRSAALPRSTKPSVATMGIDIGKIARPCHWVFRIQSVATRYLFRRRNSWSAAL
jgi:hypothetical protein